MEFKEQQSIFQQIAEHVIEQILTERLKANDKLSSVRETAGNLGVNPNTIMRAYTELLNDNIIYNKRGIGYFVSDSAKETILEKRKKEFLENNVPQFIHQLKMLNFNKKEIDKILKQLNNQKH